MAEPSASPNPERADRPPARVFVVRLGAVGDVVRTLPAVRLLRRSWPEAEICWVVEDGAEPLLAGHPDLDDVVLLPRRDLSASVPRHPWRGWGQLSGFLSELRGFAAELSLDFQSSFKSGLVAWLSRAPRRVGFDRPFGRERSHVFATERVRLDEPRIHRVERAVRLALAAGARPGPLEADLALREEETRSGRERLAAIAGGSRAVLVAPFSSRRQAWKRYPLERWAEVARRLSADGFAVVVLSGPSEEREVRELCRAGGERVRPCGDLDLRQLAALISAAEVLVGGDTGPMHLGWAGGARVVAIYGPTDPVLNAPFGQNHVVLAPPVRTGREDDDRFPGITPELVAGHARRLMMETSP